MTIKEIDNVLLQQRQFFQTGATIPIKFRIEMLKKLRATIKKYECDIEKVLTLDLGKSDYEGFMCEVGLVLTELTYMIKNTRKFAKEKRVHTPLAQFAS